jgi:hypothetical protein
MGRLDDRELVVKGYALDREDDPEFKALMVRSVVVDPKVKTRGNYGRQCRPSRRGLEIQQCKGDHRYGSEHGWRGRRPSIFQNPSPEVDRSQY